LMQRVGPTNSARLSYHCELLMPVFDHGSDVTQSQS
jgi:hypothetical protein